MLRSSLLFWFFFGWLAFPFFINVSPLQDGSFATRRMRYVGYVYIFFLILLLCTFSIESVAWLFWIGLTGALLIYIFMGIFIYYFDGEEYEKKEEVEQLKNTHPIRVVL